MRPLNPHSRCAVECPANHLGVAGLISAGVTEFAGHARRGMVWRAWHQGILLCRDGEEGRPVHSRLQVVATDLVAPRRRTLLLERFDRRGILFMLRRGLVQRCL